MVYLFNKKVDKSLLSHGLAIPTSAINTLTQILTVNPSRGKSAPIKILFNQNFYSARIYNVNLKDSNREMWQILYTPNGNLANAFKNAFKHYSIDNQFISLYGENNKLYIDSFNQEDVINIKNTIDKFDDDEMERIIFNSNDDKASIVSGNSLIKYRKLNRCIGEQLKKYYGFRCQICGVKPFSEFDYTIVEIHHIDNFSVSMNNNAINLIVLCPNHHRLLHKSRPLFDREKLCFLYDNNIEEKIILTEHFRSLLYTANTQENEKNKA